MGDFSARLNNEFKEEILTEHKLAEQSVYELSVEYPLDAAAEFLSKVASPDEMFSDRELEIWAEDHGYTKAD